MIFTTIDSNMEMKKSFTLFKRKNENLNSIPQIIPDIIPDKMVFFKFSGYLSDIELEGSS